MADFKRLEKNIIDMIKEYQIKLGYSEETISLYYPLDSLNSLLDIKCTKTEIKEVLIDFKNDVKSRLGEILISVTGERFCFTFGVLACKYVKDNTPSSGFMYDLINLMRNHNISLIDIENVFNAYSDKVIFKEMESDDFDYLFYFEDDVPDDYRYCFKDEGHHMIYHRFTKKDYEEYDF